MHGNRPSLKDITLILDEIPEIVDLHCDEQFDSSEEENNHHQLTEPDVQAYGVVTTCCKCGRTVRLVVECGQADLRELEQLFLKTLTLVCPHCA
uniref:Protein E7 n=1 Tax=Human papillomavirus type 2 TaxID=333751 RepID=A3F912_9PAPI|nr:early protein E7 [Human papillomavirus type 2]